MMVQQMSHHIIRYNLLQLYALRFYYHNTDNRLHGNVLYTLKASFQYKPSAQSLCFPFFSFSVNSLMYRVTLRVDT